MRAFLLAIVAYLCTTPFAEDVFVVRLENVDYPELARQARLEGTIVVTVEFDPDGKAISAKSENGHAILREEAEKNARTWWVKPFPGGRQPRNSTLRIEYQFQLEGKGVTHVPRPRVEYRLPSSVRITSQRMMPQP